MAEFGGFGGEAFGSGPQKPIAALGVVATLVLIRTQDSKAHVEMSKAEPVRPRQLPYGLSDKAFAPGAVPSTALTVRGAAVDRYPTSPRKRSASPQACLHDAQE